MLKSAKGPVLTKPDVALHYKQMETIRGMAHWAGSGPEGKVCGVCKKWITVDMVSEQNRAGNDQLIGQMNKCLKFRELTGKFGPVQIPINTKACRHFEDK